MKLPFKFHVRAEADNSSPATISIRGLIGDSLDSNWNIKNTEEEVLNELNAIPAGKKIKVHVNSLGGRVDYALGIYNALRSRKGDITTVNAGFACSSGSLLMLAGDNRICPDSSLVMIHLPMGGGEGNIDDLAKIIEGVKTCSELMADIYAKAMNITPQAAMDMMRKETYMTGKQAVQCGFATESGDDSLMEADDTSDTQARSRIIATFKNIPENLRSRFTAQAPTQTQPKINKMKSIINALVAAGFTLQTDAEEAAVLAVVNPILAESKRLKSENEAHVTARKSRVTAMVETAITEKIVGEARKPKLIALGESDEAELVAQLADLRALKTEPANQGRGARPVAKKEGAGDETLSLEEVRAEMAEPMTTPARKSELAILARGLRGHGKLFKPETN